MAVPARYDALLILSFGGPEKPADVIPFLENVTRGRNIPRARLEQVAEQYYLFGGVSPINGINRELVAKLRALFTTEGPSLPIYWGNRNWHPFLEATVRTMHADGVRSALAFATSAYSSYSSCRQYLDDIDKARRAIGPEAPEITKIRPYWNHPRFIELMIEHTRAALDLVSGPRRLVFTAHSLPLSMASACDYEQQLREAAALVADAVGHAADWDLAFQSRSGPPTQPWLEPDINDHLTALAKRGIKAVAVVPIGFVADHMEVVFDLDTQAAATAQQLGITMARAHTAGTTAAFVAMIRELVIEAYEGRPPAFVGRLGARPSPCPADCCPHPVAGLTSAATDHRQLRS